MIRDYILEQKREIIGNNPLSDDASDESEEIIVDKKPDELILQLSITDLLKVGISQNHIKTAFIIMGIGWGFMDASPNPKTMKMKGFLVFPK